MTPSDTPCTHQEYEILKAKKSTIRPIYTEQLQVYGKTMPVKPMRPNEQEQTLCTDKDLSKSNKIACLCAQQACLHQLAYMGGQPYDNTCNKHVSACMCVQHTSLCCHKAGFSSVVSYEAYKAIRHLQPCSVST